jgi:imidazolonepropionase-like amidohydrolase
VKLNGSHTTVGLVLRANAAVKANIGSPSDRQSASLTRLNNYANLRETLIETQAYLQRQRQYRQALAKYTKQKAEQKEKKEGGNKEEDLKQPATPRPEPVHAILAKVLEKKIPLQIEAHRVDDVLNALRLADEFELSLILEGCTEGYRITGEILRRKVPVVVGPVSTSFAAMPQLVYRGHDPANAGILATSGIQTAIGVAGRDGLSSKFAALAGAMAVAHGMGRGAALRALTLTPAEIFGVADRIGSLEVGKDADLVIMSGHPFDATSRIEQVLIEGRTVYERKDAP